MTLECKCSVIPAMIPPRERKLLSLREGIEIAVESRYGMEPGPLGVEGRGKPSSEHPGLVVFPRQPDAPL